MSSNPTFFLDDPLNGDQILQKDRRTTFGGRIEKTIRMQSTLEAQIGAEARYDDIPDVGVNHTKANVILASIANNAVREGSVSPYAGFTWSANDKWRLNGGLRGDFYAFDVAAHGPGSVSGSKADAIASPSVSLAYRPFASLELYADWGQGFHSNDARGVVNGAAPVPGLVKGEGKELGARFQRGGLSLTAAYWRLDIDSELKFVGDSNSVEPSSASARHGYELTFFYRPWPWLALDGAWTKTHARFLDAPGADFIPDALEHVGEAGISAILEKWEASARLRYVGSYPIVEDNSVRAPVESEVNLRGAWKPAAGLTLYAELLNALDDRHNDIEYVYTSRLPGEPAAGVDGILARAMEPRTLRVGVRKDF
jgi:outer membrane receptor protein involved in Fe transport